MCGIIGCVGHKNAKKTLINGLQTLEYRGYDSAGISYFSDDKIETVKTVGKVSCLRDKVAAAGSDEATCGIGRIPIPIPIPPDGLH